MEAGFTVKSYIWHDTCPLARRVAATLIPKLMRRFLGQLPASAVRGFDTKLPADVRLTSAMMLANLGQIDIVVRGLGVPVDVKGWEKGRDGRCQGDMLLRPRTLPQLLVAPKGVPSSVCVCVCVCVGEHVYGKYDGFTDSGG